MEDDTDRVKIPPNPIAVADKCVGFYADIDQLHNPYDSLKIESTTEVQKLIDIGQEIFDDMTALKGQNRNKVVRLVGKTKYYHLGGQVSTLEEYRKRIERIEDFGDKLKTDPLFAEFAGVALSHGDIYVSGGSIARAVNGKYRQGFAYESDLDVITICKGSEFDEMADDIAQRFAQDRAIAISRSDGPLKKVSVVDLETGRELINIVPAEFFANRARRVANILGEDLTGLSDIEIMMTRWTPNVLSQVAVHFDGEMNMEVVNGGKPLVNNNLRTENENSYTSWRTIRRLYESGGDKEADLLLVRAIWGLARIPKGFKDIGYDNSIDNSEVLTRNVALAELMLGDDVMREDVAKVAAKNMVTAISTHSRKLWELPKLGFDGVFSKTLLASRGFKIDGTGEKIGDRYVVFPKPENLESFAKVVVLDALTDQLLDDSQLYNENNRCESPTEFFAVIAGINMCDDSDIDKIADEIEKNWPDKLAEGFNKDKFIRWSREISLAVKKSGVDYQQIVKIDPDKSDEIMLMVDYDDEFVGGVEKIAESVKDTQFWKERIQN